MPKSSTYPTLYDEVKTLSIASLKGWGYLKPNCRMSGIVTWRRADHITGKISIAVYMEETSGVLELDYKYQEEPVNYKVSIVSTPSNLGKGLIWYFFCPHAGKKCRKLYGVGKYFLHREAFRGCMYESQTRSHKDRILVKTLEASFAPEKFMEGRRKHFKRFYRGRPTKRYLKYLGLQRKAVDGINDLRAWEFF